MALRGALRDANLEELHTWWQTFKVWMMTQMDTLGDVTVRAPGKGIILTNPQGTIKKRLRLSNDGTSIVLEDV